MGKVECIKRLGHVLLGRVEPSVEAVLHAARGVVALAHNPAAPLHKIYDGVVLEPSPSDMAGMLAELDKINGGPRSYAPSAKGGNDGGHSQPD